MYTCLYKEIASKNQYLSRKFYIVIYLVHIISFKLQKGLYIIC